MRAVFSPKTVLVSLCWDVVSPRLEFLGLFWTVISKLALARLRIAFWLESRQKVIRARLLRLGLSEPHPPFSFVIFICSDFCISVMCNRNGGCLDSKKKCSLYERLWHQWEEVYRRTWDWLELTLLLYFLGWMLEKARKSILKSRARCRSF